MMPNGSITFTIDSQFENVALVGMAINRICSRSEMSEKSASETEVAVVEAVNNSIEHAYHGLSGHPVITRLELFNDRVVISVIDYGDAAELAEPPPSAAADPEYPLRGRGRQMMQALMHSVGYERVEHRNIVTLTRYFHESPARRQSEPSFS